MMDFFKFPKSSRNPNFVISEADRGWIEDNFEWLIQALGYPSPDQDPILFDGKSFPKTLAATSVSIPNVIQDLCEILQIDVSKVTYETLTDVRDFDVPYEIGHEPFSTDLQILGKYYKVIVANSLQKHPRRLVYSLVHEFIKIKLTEYRLQFDTGDDTNLFVYLAGVYLGFGVILSENLRETGRSSDGLWETKWNFISEMPIEVLAFALATYAKLSGHQSPKWKVHLTGDLKAKFDSAFSYLDEHPTPLYDKLELDANELFRDADKLYQDSQFESAISQLQKILFITQDEGLRAVVFNNLGYYNLRLRNYKRSIEYFKKSIAISPDFGYANDNLGYALIQMGELDEGKSWVEKASQTNNNDIAYTYRNLALYYQAKGEANSAEEFFRKAFDSAEQPVDLLELHYADFLFQKGDIKSAWHFLDIAVKKGEPEAITRFNQLKNQKNNHQ